MPAENLINGRSIAHVEEADVAEIVYCNLELEKNDVILEEGAAAETFLPIPGAREAFSNYAEFAELYPDDTCADAAEVCATVQGAWSRGDLAASKIRRIISPIIDRRRPLEIACDRLAKRAAQSVVASTQLAM